MAVSASGDLPDGWTVDENGFLQPPTNMANWGAENPYGGVTGYPLGLPPRPYGPTGMRALPGATAGGPSMGYPSVPMPTGMSLNSTPPDVSGDDMFSKAGAWAAKNLNPISSAEAATLPTRTPTGVATPAASGLVPGPLSAGSGDAVGNVPQSTAPMPRPVPTPGFKPASQGNVARGGDFGQRFWSNLTTPGALSIDQPGQPSAAGGYTQAAGSGGFDVSQPLGRPTAGRARRLPSAPSAPSAPPYAGSAYQAPSQPNSPFTMVLRPNAPANYGGRMGGGTPLTTALDLSGYNPNAAPPPAPRSYNLGYGGGGNWQVGQPNWGDVALGEQIQGNGWSGGGRGGRVAAPPPTRYATPYPPPRPNVTAAPVQPQSIMPHLFGGGGNQPIMPYLVPNAPVSKRFQQGPSPVPGNPFMFTGGGV